MEKKWKSLDDILSEDKTLTEKVDINSKLHDNDADYTISEVLESYNKLTNKHK